MKNDSPGSVRLGGLRRGSAHGLLLPRDPTRFAPRHARLERLHPERDDDGEGEQGERARVGAEEQGGLARAFEDDVVGGEDLHERRERRDEEEDRHDHVTDEAGGIVRILFLAEEHRNGRKERRER